MKKLCQIPSKIWLAMRKACRGTRVRPAFTGGAFNFHCLELTYLAYSARDRSRLDIASRPEGALADDALVAIVMAVTAAETFINELPHHIRASQAVFRDDEHSPVTLAMARCADALEDEVEQWGTLEAKYQVAGVTLSGQMFSKGKAPLQDFLLLIKIRNAIIHLKPVWVTEKHRNRQLVEQLIKRKLTYPSDPDYGMPWLNLLETPAIAAWACATARRMMLAVLALTPDGPIQFDPLKFTKERLRDDARFWD